MADQVTVYSTTTCPWCDRTKDFLKKNNVPFVNKDVSSDYSAAMEMVRRSGRQGVPVITTDDEVIVGFDRPLKKIVDRFAGPKRPALGLLGADAESYLSSHPDVAVNFAPGTKGVYVGQIRPGSVASKSGTLPGDVVASVAGKHVRNLTDLDRLVGTLKPGEAVSVRYVRGPEDHETTFQF